MFLYVMELTGGALLVLAITTQLLIPAIKGRVLFPMFRREAKLKKELVEVEQKLSDKDLRARIDKKLDQYHKDNPQE